MYAHSPGGAGVNLRAGPGMGAPILAGVPPGAPLRVSRDARRDEGGREWRPASYRGERGWVRADLLLARAPRAAAYPLVLRAVAPGGVGLNLRAAPRPDAPVIADVPDGAIVEAGRGLAPGPGGTPWRPARYAGAEGYVRADLLAGGARAILRPERP